MTLVSVFVFLAPVLAGLLIVHLNWQERTAWAILFKICLGAGLGLGISSLVYFLGLLGAMDRQGIFIVQVLLLVLIILIAVLREKGKKEFTLGLPSLSGVQLALFVAALAAVVLSGLIYINLTQTRPQGTYDAWSIWNRAARFIYRDPENWSATASPQLYWAAHPDYPLLIPMNVAWGWDIVGTESQRIPQVQSALFTFASIGLMFTSIGMLRTMGQASLASIILMSTPVLLEAGYPQIADIPLSFFILASCVLMYMYFRYESPVLLVLSGFAAGLAAWTKNEGLLFVMTSFTGLLVVARGNFRRTLVTYLAGLAIPMAVVLYFKLAIAPPNDMLSMGEASLVDRFTEGSRFWLVGQALFKELWNYAGWPGGIVLQLAGYAFLVRLDIPAGARRGSLVVAVIVLAQILGYCIIYVLTPHDLAWHLNFSFARLIFHIYPAAIFLYFCSVTDPERIFIRAAGSEAAHGAKR